MTAWNYEQIARTANYILLDVENGNISDAIKKLSYLRKDRALAVVAECFDMDSLRPVQTGSRQTLRRVLINQGCSSHRMF